MKNSRNQDGNKVYDPASIANMEFSDLSGSKKVSEVGRHLVPLKFISVGVVTYTTDATTIRRLDNSGACLAVYNNSAGVLSVTLGEASTQSSLAAGATDATGHVGIPCAPNAWTYIACANSNWVISSSALLLVFLIDDNTSVKTEVL